MIVFADEQSAQRAQQQSISVADASGTAVQLKVKKASLRLSEELSKEGSSGFGNEAWFCDRKGTH